MTEPPLAAFLAEIDRLGKSLMEAGLSPEDAVALAAELILRGVGIMLGGRVSDLQCAGIVRSIMETLIEIRGKPHA